MKILFSSGSNIDAVNNNGVSPRDKMVEMSQRSPEYKKKIRSILQPSTSTASQSVNQVQGFFSRLFDGSR